MKLYFMPLLRPFAKVLITCLTLFACACSTNQKYFGSDDLLVTDNANLKPPENLTSTQARHDLNLFIYAFENAYGGRKFIPKEQYQKALENLKLLINQPPMTAKDLCRAIDEILLQINDFHLIARLDGNRCSPLDETRFRKASVGKNVQSEKKKPWSVTNIKIKGNNIPIISITSFPKHEDKDWDGFLDAVLALRQSAKAVLIDLRGNGGGDDTMGRNMASYFYGQDFSSPVQSQVRSQTPETFALLVNNYKLRIIRLKNKGEPVPEYLSKRLSDAILKYDQAKSGKIPAEYESINSDGKPFDPKKGYTKPIYILIDAECESSCESTVEAFEMHPYAVTVGENTGGFIHFGNLGNLLLPNSKISVQMATDYWKFKDGRFVEGIGYAPKIAVPAGTDALDVAKKAISNQL